MKKILNTDKKRAITVTTIFGCIGIAVILISLNTGTLSIAPLKVIQTLLVMVILRAQPCYMIIVCQNYNHHVSWHWPWDFRCDFARIIT